jgi:SPX domain protein involved in polyphosphate accumulation
MNLSNISQYFNRLDLIKDTANQIIKDFDMFGLEIKFSGNAYNAYEELFEQIEPHINKLISTNQQKFMSILYRIDLSDEQVKKAVNENNSEPFSAIVSDLIIKRELQKVVIRSHYKRDTPPSLPTGEEQAS